MEQRKMTEMEQAIDKAVRARLEQLEAEKEVDRESSRFSLTLVVLAVFAIFITFLLIAP